MIKPGPRNLITDVAGIRVGNAEDPRLRTGTTVVLPDQPVVAAADIRGGAPGTRETSLLDPSNTVEEVHAVVLSGGSTFGLDAASGVVDWLRSAGRGLAVGNAVIPLVPAAILFDLGGGDSWGEANPYAAFGRAACHAAAQDVALGNAGAGMGAIAGALKGGLGSASAVTEDGLQVGALVAANPVGSSVMPAQPVFWAWPLEQDSEFGGQAPPTAGADLTPELYFSGHPEPPMPAASTTIGVVATNARLRKAQAQRIAIMAQDGIARAVRPAHTPFDGDALFCIATGAHEPSAPPEREIARLGALAADCVARAIARGVYEARALDGSIPDYRSVLARPPRQP